MDIIDKLFKILKKLKGTSDTQSSGDYLKNTNSTPETDFDDNTLLEQSKEDGTDNKIQSQETTESGVNSAIYSARGDIRLGSKDLDISMDSKEENSNNNNETRIEDTTQNDDRDPKDSIRSPTDTQHVPLRYLSLWDEAKDLIDDESYVLSSHFDPENISKSIDDWREAVADLELIITKIKQSEDFKDADFKTYELEKHNNIIQIDTEQKPIINDDKSISEFIEKQEVANRIDELIDADNSDLCIEDIADNSHQSSSWLDIWAKWVSLGKIGSFNRERVPVSRIHGVGDSLSTSLSKSGYETLHDVRCATPSNLQKVDGIGEKRAKRIHAWVADRPINHIHGIGDTTYYNLLQNGIQTAAHLTAVSEEDLTDIEAIGHQRAQQLHAKAAVWLPTNCSPPQSLLEEYNPPYKSKSNAQKKLKSLEQALHQYAEGITPGIRELKNIEDELSDTPIFDELFFEQYRPPFEEVSEVDKSAKELEIWIDICKRLVTVSEDISELSFPNYLFDGLDITAPSKPSFDADAIIDPNSHKQTDKRVTKMEAKIRRQHKFQQHLHRASDLYSRAMGMSGKHTDEIADGILHQAETHRLHVEELDSPEYSEQMDQYLTACEQAFDLIESYPGCSFDLHILRLGEIGQKKNLPADDLEDSLIIMRIAESALNLTHDLNYNHPSINVKNWKKKINFALSKNDPESLKPVSTQLERLQNGIWEIDDLHGYEWQAFEKLIGNLYRDNGFDVEVTQSTADLGVDIWATKTGRRVAIQVKQNRTGQTVGREPLQKVSSTIAKGDADRAVVVTSSSFADTATNYAREFGSNLTLVNSDDLIKRLSDSSLSPSTKRQ